MTRPGTGSVAWKMAHAVMSALVNSFTTPSPSGSVPMPKRSVACIPSCWLNELTVNCLRETTAPA